MSVPISSYEQWKVEQELKWRTNSADSLAKWRSGENLDISGGSTLSNNQSSNRSFDSYISDVSSTNTALSTSLNGFDIASLISPHNMSSLSQQHRTVSAPAAYRTLAQRSSNFPSMVPHYPVRSDSEYVPDWGKDCKDWSKEYVMLQPSHLITGPTPPPSPGDQTEPTRTTSGKRKRLDLLDEYVVIEAVKKEQTDYPHELRELFHDIVETKTRLNSMRALPSISKRKEKSRINSLLDRKIKKFKEMRLTFLEACLTMEKAVIQNLIDKANSEVQFNHSRGVVPHLSDALVTQINERLENSISLNIKQFFADTVGLDIKLLEDHNFTYE